MSPQKHYANCGIQTDSYDFSSGSVPSSESDITLANGSLVFESAYSQSPDSQNHDSPSLLSSRYCLDRSTGIVYGRPSEPRLSTKKRVISLTSVSSTGKFKTTMPGDKLQVRLVSMPERGKYASVSAKDSLLEKQCIDNLGNTNNDEQMERLYPADLPQTPSPPSSPESVTIIGNNTHVPGSFLRQPGYIDNDGWVSWANSPPRPIPALHGPSSLPYARCPSGAEGTLVEGDDLSHKIWGLGIEDSQMVNLPATTIRQTFQPQDHRPPQTPTASSEDEFTLSHYLERDAVIDLSRPATFYGHVDTQRVLSKRMPALPMPTSRQTIFVPASANMKAYSLKQRYAPQSEKPLPYVFSAPRRPSVFNNPAEQHQQPDAQSFLPTPPSTASPCWTPIFSHEPEMATSKSMVLTLNPKVSKADSYSPKIYSPISNLEDDSSRIGAIMQQDALHEADIVYNSKVVPRTRFQNNPFAFQAYLPKLDSLQKDDVSSCLKATSGSFHDQFMLFPTNHENSLRDGIVLPQTEAAGGTQGSTERRRNLSYQQPRSIPLARLIQRRLSSVAEEDQSTKILFSFLQEAQTGGFTRSKGLSLESLGRPMPRIGLLDEEIFTTEIFTAQTEADHRLVYEAESMLKSDEPNVVVKLPRKGSVLRHEVDSNRGKKNLRYDVLATLNTRPTANSDPSTRHKIRVKKQSTATNTTDDT